MRPTSPVAVPISTGLLSLLLFVCAVLVAVGGPDAVAAGVGLTDTILSSVSMIPFLRKAVGKLGAGQMLAKLLMQLTRCITNEHSCTL
jgi:hypothetical protein